MPSLGLRPASRAPRSSKGSSAPATTYSADALKFPTQSDRTPIRIGVVPPPHPPAASTSATATAAGVTRRTSVRLAGDPHGAAAHGDVPRALRDADLRDHGVRPRVDPRDGVVERARDPDASGAERDPAHAR